MGGKASGRARRRKAAMRDTMNRLVTMKVEVEGLSDILMADGGESTYEEMCIRDRGATARRLTRRYCDCSTQYC